MCSWIVTVWGPGLYRPRVPPASPVIFDVELLFIPGTCLLHFIRQPPSYLSEALTLFMKPNFEVLVCVMKSKPGTASALCLKHKQVLQDLASTVRSVSEIILQGNREDAVNASKAVKKGNQNQHSWGRMESQEVQNGSSIDHTCS